MDTEELRQKQAMRDRLIDVIERLKARHGEDEVIDLLEEKLRAAHAEIGAQAMPTLPAREKLIVKTMRFLLPFSVWKIRRRVKTAPVLR
ncbi:MAG: hypothetical protein SWH61_12970 [Thermodesulfobacteriota bacterium]|nr:hypothetical protein [Thermodesulfobacteriota bacterium]